jgi:hypothetical protein
MTPTTMRFDDGLRLHIRIVLRIDQPPEREVLAPSILEIRMPKDGDTVATILNLQMIQVPLP